MPVALHDLPVLKKDLPVALHDLPVLKKDLPVALHDLPVSIKDLPVTLHDLSVLPYHPVFFHRNIPGSSNNHLKKPVLIGSISINLVPFLSLVHISRIIKFLNYFLNYLQVTFYYSNFALRIEAGERRKPYRVSINLKEIIMKYLKKVILVLICALALSNATILNAQVW